MTQKRLYTTSYENFTEIDPLFWAQPVDLEGLYKFPTDQHTVAILKPVDLRPALIVGFWVPKDDFCDDPGVLLELYDGSSIENKNVSFVEAGFQTDVLSSSSDWL